MNNGAQKYSTASFPLSPGLLFIFFAISGGSAECKDIRWWHSDLYTSVTSVSMPELVFAHFAFIYTAL